MSTHELKLNQENLENELVNIYANLINRRDGLRLNNEKLATNRVGISYMQEVLAREIELDDRLARETGILQREFKEIRENLLSRTDLDSKRILEYLDKRVDKIL